MTTVHYVNANLHHDLVTGRSVTAIPHTVNATPTDWYSKNKQQWRHESEFMPKRIAVDQIVDLR